MQHQQTREIGSVRNKSHQQQRRPESPRPGVQVNTRYLNSTRGTYIFCTSVPDQRYILCTSEDGPLAEFMYLVFTRMPSEEYRRWLRSLLLCLCDALWVLINSLVWDINFSYCCYDSVVYSLSIYIYIYCVTVVVVDAGGGTGHVIQFGPPNPTLWHALCVSSTLDLTFSLLHTHLFLHTVFSLLWCLAFWGEWKVRIVWKGQDGVILKLQKRKLFFNYFILILMPERINLEVYFNWYCWCGCQKLWDFFVHLKLVWIWYCD